ncbi:MAG: hypothetical protein GTO22_14410 [Gemmatimonadales bacterium]|nr:hypothetical protein [Gemmatimonadales bacterium]
MTHNTKTGTDIFSALDNPEELERHRIDHQIEVAKLRDRADADAEDGRFWNGHPLRWEVLEAWADSHNTCMPVAVAIREIATESRPMDEIWGDPTGPEMAAVVADAWGRAVDGEETLFWGEASFSRDGVRIDGNRA